MMKKSACFMVFLVMFRLCSTAQWVVPGFVVEADGQVRVRSFEGKADEVLSIEEDMKLVLEKIETNAPDTLPSFYTEYNTIEGIVFGGQWAPVLPAEDGDKWSMALPLVFFPSEVLHEWNSQGEFWDSTFFSKEHYFCNGDMSISNHQTYFHHLPNGKIDSVLTKLIYRGDMAEQYFNESALGLRYLENGKLQKLYFHDLKLLDAGFEESKVSELDFEYEQGNLVGMIKYKAWKDTSVNYDSACSMLQDQGKFVSIDESNKFYNQLVSSPGGHELEALACFSYRDQNLSEVWAWHQWSTLVIHAEYLYDGNLLKEFVLDNESTYRIKVFFEYHDDGKLAALRHEFPWDSSLNLQRFEMVYNKDGYLVGYR